LRATAEGGEAGGDEVLVMAAAVVDGVMVSARAWPDHPAWMRGFVRVLRGERSRSVPPS